MIRITECPRDAMQGISVFIPTEKKIAYLQKLLSVGFSILDMGSFVSPKAIPQMADTAAVVEALDMTTTTTKLLVIVANTKGAEQAVQYDKISYIGFPFSISPTFQQKNTNATLEEAFQRIIELQNLVNQHNKQLQVYISMAFGNPYQDAWSMDILKYWLDKIIALGITNIALADTTGVANEASIQDIYTTIQQAYHSIPITAHLHSTPDTAADKIKAAIEAGCKSFDVAIKGFGGCPMAAHSLTGNIATEKLIHVLESKNIPYSLDKQAFEEAYDLSTTIFNTIIP